MPVNHRRKCWCGYCKNQEMAEAVAGFDHKLAFIFVSPDLISYRTGIPTDKDTEHIHSHLLFHNFLGVGEAALAADLMALEM